MAIWSMCVSLFLAVWGMCDGRCLYLCGLPREKGQHGVPGCWRMGRDALEDTWEVSLVELRFAP